MTCLLGFVVGLVYRALEVADALTQGTANVPEFAWAEDDQNDSQQKQQMRRCEQIHVFSPNPSGRIGYL